MGLITAVVDVQDSSGNTLVAATSDPTRPVLVLKLGAGLAGSYVKSGDQGIVTLAVGPQSSLVVGLQTPAQATVDAAAAASVALANITLVQVTIPAGKMASIEVNVTLGISVPALGFVCFSRWCGVIRAEYDGVSAAAAFVGGLQTDTVRTLMSTPFGSAGAAPAGIGTAINVSAVSLTLTPIDLVTAFAGAPQASGAWAQNKTVTGTVVGSGSALGYGNGNTILAAGGHWYFYTAGTTSNAGSGPTHTSGSAADGSATAYYGGTVAAGVPMVATVTWRKVEIGP